MGKITNVATPYWLRSPDHFRAGAKMVVVPSAIYPGRWVLCGYPTTLPRWLRGGFGRLPSGSRQVGYCAAAKRRSVESVGIKPRVRLSV